MKTKHVHLHAAPARTLEVPEQADVRYLIGWDKVAWAFQRNTQWRKKHPIRAALWRAGLHPGPPHGWFQYPNDEE